MPVGINHFIFIGSLMFGFVLCIVITSRNIIKILCGIILMFLSSVLNFTAFSNFKWFNPEAQIIVLTVICLFILLLITGFILAYNFFKKYKILNLEPDNID